MKVLENRKRRFLKIGNQDSSMGNQDSSIEIAPDTPQRPSESIRSTLQKIH